MKTSRKLFSREFDFTNFFHSFSAVSMLGVAIVFLGFCRISWFNIPGQFMLGISTASLGFIIIEFFKLKGITVNIVQLLSFISILGMPFFPFINQMSIDSINLYNDSFSLIAMGLTITLISRRGLNEITNFITNTSKDIKTIKTQIDEFEKEKDGIKTD